MKISPAEIRPCRLSDIPVIIEILKIYNMDNVPSPEMPEFEVSRYVVADLYGLIVGFAGFRFVNGKGVTTLSAVHPKHTGNGTGYALQERRLADMQASGCTTATTFSDNPETIAWWIKYFNYRVVGSKPKLHGFGMKDIHHWTELEVDL